MKLIPIFKMPRNKRFNFAPRYYDPIKEEVKERTEMIRKHGDLSGAEFYRSNISQAFARKSRRHTKGNALQFSFVILFAAVIIGYLYFGAAALYSFLIILPLYILIKLRKNI